MFFAVLETSAARAMDGCEGDEKVRRKGNSKRYDFFRKMEGNLERRYRLEVQQFLATPSQYSKKD